MNPTRAANLEEPDLAKLFSLKGRVCVITGASGGLGSRISSGFASLGSTVVLVGRNKKKLALLREEIEAAGWKASVQVADILNADGVERMARSVYHEHGTIDVLVTAHGVNLRIPSSDYPLDKWQEVIDVNLRGTFVACKAVGRYMIQQRSGKIVNISSTAGSSGYEWGYSAYAPSKGGVDSLTRTLAVEWGKYGICVNSVAPYFIRTELTKKFLSDPDRYRKILDSVPLGRVGRPLDVVGAVVFLASPAADWISGQVLYVDGGYMAR